MQSLIDRSLPDECVIQGQTWASDGMGGGSVSYDAAGTVACRVSPGGLSPNETPIGGMLTPVGFYTITMPAGTIVSAKSRITSGGRTFEVLEAKHRSWEISTRVSATEVVS